MSLKFYCGKCCLTVCVEKREGGNSLMRKKMSRGLIALAAVLISTGAAGGKTVHADELSTSVEITQSEEQGLYESGEDESDVDSEELTEEAASEELSEETAEEESSEELSEETAEEAASEELSSEEMSGETSDELNSEDLSEETEEVSSEELSDEIEEVTDSEEVSEEVSSDEIIDDEKIQAEEADSKEIIGDEKEEAGKVDVINKDALKNDTLSELSSDTDAVKKDEEIKPVITNDEDVMAPVTVGWHKEGDKWRYYYAASSDQYYKDGIIVIDGVGYRFDSEGYMQTGWIEDGGYWYFADKSGHLAQGWLTQNGVSFFFGYTYKGSDGKSILDGYYMNKNGIFDIYDDSYLFADNGVMKVGWIKQWGSVYYAKPDGKLAKGWQVIDNNDYHFGDTILTADNKYIPDGYYMQTFFANLYGKTYYFGESGALKKGWIDVCGDQSVYYYSNVSGVIVQGWAEIDGKWYYFGDSYKNSDGEWAIYGTDMRRNGVYYIKDEPYWFDKSGALQIGWIKDIYKDSDGKENIDWYYSNSKGVLQSGWTKIDDKYYFFGYPNNESDGTYTVNGFFMIKNIYEIGKYYYYFNESGVLKQNGWIEFKNFDSEGNYIYSNWFYATANGNLAQGWTKINGKWYFFGHVNNIGGKEIIEGYNLRRYEYLAKDGNKYYLDQSGVLQTGFYDIANMYGNMPYYASSSGVITEGWKQVNGNWYYTDSNGLLCRGNHIIDGKQYYFGERGDMKKGWIREYDSVWHYGEKTGELVKGWKTIGGKKYYFDMNGTMATDLLRVGSSVYLFGEDGALVTGKTGWKKTYSRENWYLYDVECFVNKDGTVRTEPMKNSAGDIYVIDSYGVLVKNSVVYLSEGNDYFLVDNSGKVVKKSGWVSGIHQYLADESDNIINELAWYYLNSDYSVNYDAIMKINGAYYAFDEDGIMVKGYGGMIYDEEKNYYREGLFGEDGKEITVNGWKKIDNKWYYLKDGDVYSSGLYTIDKADYYFRDDGVLVTDKKFIDTGTFYGADKNGRITVLPKGWQYVEDIYEGYGGNWYYLESEGKSALSDKFITIGKDKYYFDDGKMLIGVQYVPEANKIYVFADDGKMLTGGWYKSNYWGGWFYSNPDGTAYEGYLTQNGKTYYISNGRLQSEFVDYAGNINLTNNDYSARRTPGFYKRKDEFFGYESIYYVAEDGYGLLAGWHVIDGDTYYITAGRVTTGTTYMYSDKFVFDSNGKLISKN